MGETCSTIRMTLGQILLCCADQQINETLFALRSVDSLATTEMRKIAVLNRKSNFLKPFHYRLTSPHRCVLAENLHIQTTQTESL